MPRTLRNAWIAGWFVVGACALVATSAAKAGDEKTADGVTLKDKNETGCFNARLEHLFSAAGVIEVRLETVAASDSKDGPGARPANAPLERGQVVFVDLATARVIDENGIEKTRDDKAAWFTKDDGWAVLRMGQRLKIEYRGRREIPAHKDFPPAAVVDGKILAYRARVATLLPASGADLAVGEAGVADGVIATLSPSEKRIEVTIEALNLSAPAGNSPTDSATAPLQVGQKAFFDVEHARIIDEKGEEREREDKTAWFAKDDGWAILKAGAPVRIRFQGSRDAKDSAGVTHRLYTALLVDVSPTRLASGTSPVVGVPGACEGAIVQLFAKEKLLEVKVESVSVPPSDNKGALRNPGQALRAGELILVCLEHARLVDEKGVERSREDKSAWFTKDDGWSILKKGYRVKIDYSGTRQVPAPAEFPKEARSGGDVLVYDATTVRLLPDPIEPPKR